MNNESNTLKPILKNINLKIRKGEFVIIVGSVGAGKSMLFNAMLGDLFQ